MCEISSSQQSDQKNCFEMSEHHEDFSVNSNEAGHDLFNRCQEHLQLIHLDTESLQAVKDEIRKLSKLQRAIANKKNFQSERIANLFNKSSSSNVAPPSSLEQSVQCVATQLLKQAKTHCHNAEILSRYCYETQAFLDNHQRIIKSMYEAADALRSSPSPRLVRPRSPRKVTTDRKSEQSADQLWLPSPPHHPRNRRRDYYVQEEELVAMMEIGDQDKDDLQQAYVFFETLRKPHLELSNRIDYVQSQRQNIESQIEQCKSRMYSLNALTSGKNFPWTTQTRLEELSSRLSFLDSLKGHADDEISQTMQELKDFDLRHQNALEKILSSFSSVRSRCEKLLHKSISLLNRATSLDVSFTALLPDTSPEHSHWVGSQKWQTFDDQMTITEQMNEEDVDNTTPLEQVGQGSDCIQIGNSQYIVKGYKVDEDESPGLCTEKLEESNSVSFKTAVKGNSFLHPGIGPRGSGSVQDLYCTSKESAASLSSKDHGHCVFEDESDITLRDKHQSNNFPNHKDNFQIVNNATAEEDRTNNHEAEVMKTHTLRSAERYAESNEKADKESPKFLLVCDQSKAKHFKSNHVPSICTHDMNDGESATKSTSLVENEEEKIKEYLGKYLMRLRHSGSQTFHGNSESRNSVQKSSTSISSNKEPDALEDTSHCPITSASKQKSRICAVRPILEVGPDNGNQQEDTHHLPKVVCRLEAREHGVLGSPTIEREESGTHFDNEGRRPRNQSEDKSKPVDEDECYEIIQKCGKLIKEYYAFKIKNQPVSSEDRDISPKNIIKITENESDLVYENHDDIQNAGCEAQDDEQDGYTLVCSDNHIELISPREKGGVSDYASTSHSSKSSKDFHIEETMETERIRVRVKGNFSESESDTCESPSLTTSLSCSSSYRGQLHPNRLHALENLEVNCSKNKKSTTDWAVTFYKHVRFSEEVQYNSIVDYQEDEENESEGEDSHINHQHLDGQ